MPESGRGYVLSKAAERDIESIYDFTAHEFGDRQAIDYLRGIEEKIILLAKQPLLGRNRDEVRKGLRSHVFERHVIFYKLVRKKLWVVRVLHGKQDILKKFPDH